MIQLACPHHKPQAVSIFTALCLLSLAYISSELDQLLKLKLEPYSAGLEYGEQSHGELFFGCR
jgi:hypothetical protein